MAKTEEARRSDRCRLQTLQKKGALVFVTDGRRWRRDRGLAPGRQRIWGLDSALENGNGCCRRAGRGVHSALCTRRFLQFYSLRRVTRRLGSGRSVLVSWKMEKVGVWARGAGVLARRLDRPRAASSQGQNMCRPLRKLPASRCLFLFL